MIKSSVNFFIKKKKKPYYEHPKVQFQVMNFVVVSNGQQTGPWIYLFDEVIADEILEDNLGPGPNVDVSNYFLVFC